jgi:molybdopterin/thiamine biosynthesis adenylyltransferase
MTAGTIRPGFIDEDRYERSRRIAWLDVEALGRSKCLVVGAGALGNEVVKDLVLSGIQDITLVDMDRVVRSNLNRCVFFREGDAERSLAKVDVVARRAMDLAPDSRISAREGKVEGMGTEELAHYDVIFGCLDNIAARLHLNAQACHVKVPYIDGGTDGFRGKVQVVLPPATPCLQCAMNRSHHKVMERRFSCTGADVVLHERKVAAEITTTSIIAAIQVREALKVLSGRPEACIENVEYYDGYQARSECFEIEIDPDCPNHDRS